MLLGKRFDEALVYASHIHGGQLRKGTSTPYLAHLLGVASLALESGADEDEAIAALLHDSVEDCGGAARLEDIRTRFGDRVAGIVADCSDSDTDPKPPWRQRKHDYLAALEAKPRSSLLVSLADKTHNAQAILADLHAHGDALWDRFTGGKEGSLWYYGALAQAFSRALPGPAADRLARLVEDMRDHAASQEQPAAGPGGGEDP
ncbi:MAG TPA: HD domain-containing protein [Allosphingosinicella sp.]|nr:HD domain-containing protein [Allosphingosinicella sp.]